MKRKLFYILFFSLPVIALGIDYIQFYSVPYQATLVKDSGDETLLAGITLEGFLTNSKGSYYTWQVKDGQEIVWQKSSERDIYMSKEQLEQATLDQKAAMQNLPIWDRPDLSGASGVRLPDGREWWIREESSDTQRSRYMMYWIDTQRHIYEQLELILEDVAHHKSTIMQVAVNGNRLDILVRTIKDYNPFEKAQIQWYRIDGANRTVHHVKDWMTSKKGHLRLVEGLDESPEHRLVFLNNNIIGDRVITVIDPATNREEDVLLSMNNISIYPADAVTIFSNVIYLISDEIDSWRVIRYDEAQRDFVKVSATIPDGYFINGYVYHTYINDKTPHIEVIELATGNVVYSGHVVMEGFEETLYWKR